MKFLVYFTTRPCRSVPFRCYDEKYYFRCFILPEILFFTLNKVCAQQRRAESPKGIQPRAAPWVTLNQVISALKEQKEGRKERALHWLLLRLQRAN